MLIVEQIIILKPVSMKRIFILLLICNLNASAFAQDEHLSFMDIPIDGTISEFQAKLKEKGIRHDVKGSAELPVGRRMFKGFVEGKKSDIIVSYTKTTKTVYHVKVFMTFDDRDQSHYKFYMLHDILKREFTCEKHENNGSSELGVYKAPNGIIALYTMNMEFGAGLSTYTLHLEYTDSINSNLTEKE